MPRYQKTDIDDKTMRLILRAYADGFFEGYRNGEKGNDPDIQMSMKRTAYIKMKFSKSGKE